MNVPTIIISSDLKKLHTSLIEHWFDHAKKTLDSQESFSCGLSGGKTPQGLFKSLLQYADQPLWLRTHFFQVDERFVDFEDEMNNYRMLYEQLFSQITVPESHLYPMVINATDLDLLAQAYQEKLMQYFKSQGQLEPQFDLLVLGLGEDGHTASLFPNDVVLEEDKRWVAGVAQEHRGAQSVTLTYPTINRSKKIFFLVTGENKSDILKQVLEGNEQLPAALVQPEEGACLFFCDQAAASQCTENSNDYQLFHLDEEKK